MLPELRSYERLSPELVLLVQSHNPNNPGTVTSDYLVTGARGWDWLNQLYADGRILNYDTFNDQDIPEFKVAADELVEYPTIIRVMYTVLEGKSTALFVVTELGNDADKIVSGIEKLLEKKSVTDKRVLEITIPADCENPDQYVRRLMDEFITLNNLPAEQVSLRLNTASAYRDPVTGKPTGLLYIDELPWVPNYLPDVNIEGAYPKIEADTPDEALAQSATALRGCTKVFTPYDDPAYIFGINEGTENVANLNEAPKFKLEGITDRDVVEVDMVAEYTPFIRKWAEDRNIIGGGSTTLDQFIKGLTEAGELWTHIGKGQRELMKDDVGDIYVCLVNAAGNLDIKLEEHITKLAPYDNHGGRQLYQRKGLKRFSLQVLYGLSAVAQSIENILDADNENDVEFFKTDFCDACADVVYAIETIALENDWSLTECVIAAYEDIKDRRGLMVDGTFVKEKDFTGAMVNAALADDRVKPETKDYLRGWILQQLTDETQEMEATEIIVSEGPISGVTSTTAEESADDAEPKAEIKEPFWKIWNTAQGNKNNLAPFDLNDDVCNLLNKAKYDHIVATLGVFGRQNRNGEVFMMDLDKLKAKLDELVGKTIGETSTPAMSGDKNVNTWVNRILTIIEANSAGVLVDYAILHLGDGDFGPIIEVIGLVDPSEATKQLVEGITMPYFGIRSLVLQNMAQGVFVNKVTDLVGFDLLLENPRS